MELTLTRQTGTQVAVTCDGQHSHTFELPPLPDEKKLLYSPDYPIAYGKTLYTALFPPETAAQRTLATTPERILLVTSDPDLDAIPWEYVYGPDGFLVLDCHFARGLPAEQRVPAPALKDINLHIVAVPSNPLSHDVEPLDIDGEWMRLRDIVQEIPQSIALERTRPPGIEQLRHLVAGKRHQVVHFMGHGGRDEQGGAILCFEQDNGDLAVITAREFVQRVRNYVFLVTLNACKSATPGETHFSNLAAVLVRQKIPYALGMRFNILDDDARAFSREFYGDLARGTSVEEALLQARLTLARSKRPWVIGVPVLYTSLAEPAAGFASHAGTPVIREHQPSVEAGVLPRAEGTFQGRIDELKALGTALTGDSRPRIITIHGGGGQGKTALAREAAERFAYAWPAGVWITTLENLPGRAVFVAELARFLGINLQEVTETAELERQVLLRLASQRTLIVLDNAETLVEAVEARDAAAIQLAQFIQQLPGSSVSLLVTSRLPLGWSGEMSLELGGLSPEEGAALFLQSAPQRAGDIASAQAEQLSKKLDGHPLGLLLLAKAFNESAIPLQAFITDYEVQLLKAENKYADLDHRHRTLYACIDTSVRYLDRKQRSLLSGLWIFQAPFLSDTAVAIFDPEANETEQTLSPIRDSLHTLWQRGLVTRTILTVHDGRLEFYYLLPTTRPYVEHHLKQFHESKTLFIRFGAVYAQLAESLYEELDSSSTAVAIGKQIHDDLERGVAFTTGLEQAYYLLHVARILQRLRNPRHGLKMLERALEIAQGQDRHLEWQIFNNMAVFYADIGQRQEALNFHEQALPIAREVKDRRAEATTLTNIAQEYRNTGQWQEAVNLHEQALSIAREVGDRRGEAATFSTLAAGYQGIGHMEQALSLYKQALPIWSEVGDRLGESFTLSNMASIYQQVGQLQAAQDLYEQALTIQHEMNFREDEAITLDNMAQLHQIIEDKQKALSLYERKLSIQHEVRDQQGEIITLSSIAGVYQSIGKLEQALSLYEQVLPAIHEMGDQRTEAATLNNMGYLFQSMHRYTEALTAFERSILLERQIGHPAGEAAGLAGLALVLYLDLNESEQAIKCMEQAIAVLVEAGLSQDTTRQTVDELHEFLHEMYDNVSHNIDTGNSADTLVAEFQVIISGTISVMTTMHERRTEWREFIVNMLHDIQQRGTDWHIEVDLFNAILGIIDGQLCVLSTDHPYAQVVVAIQEGIKRGGILDDGTDGGEENWSGDNPEG